jgi:hypothetical protein
MAHYAHWAHVVEARKGGQTEFWAAATHRDDALTAIASQTPPDWILVLTERCLTGEQAADLKMRHNSVRKLDATPGPAAPRTIAG